MRCLSITAALVAALRASAASAEMYAGANKLVSEYEYEDVHRGSGQKAFLGYRFAESPVMLEFAHMDLGEAQIDDFYADPYWFTDSRLGWTGNTLSLGWFYGRTDPFVAWVKGGLYKGTATFDGYVNGSPLAFEDDSNGICWGLGFEWAFSKYVGLQFDLEGMGGVKPLPDTDDSSTVTLYNFGIVGHFGSVDRSAPVRAPAPAPAVLQRPVVPAEPPAPPLQPTAPIAKAGESWLLPAGTIVRESPAADDPGIALKADTTVRLVSRWERPDGAWWIVEISGVRAWIPERDLPRSSTKELQT